MSIGTNTKYYVDREELVSLLAQAEEELKASGGDAEKNLASYLHLHRFAIGDDSMVELEGTIGILGTAVTAPRFLEEQQRHIDANPNLMFATRLPESAFQWGRQFVKEFLREIRKTICANNAESSQLKEEYQSYAKAFAVAGSAVVLDMLGVAGPMALGITTLLLLTLSRATKNAFCKMTDEEVLRAIDTEVREHQEMKKRQLKEFQAGDTTNRDEHLL